VDKVHPKRLEKGSTMDTEIADVIDNDVASLTCVCGNSASDEGMIAANSDGFPVFIEEGEVPEGLAEWPEDDDIHTLCPSCGRVYRNFDIEHENEAPVVLTVDVAKGPIADAIKIHCQNA
jgi:hypothetical protein